MSGLASRPAADGSSPNRASVSDGARLTTVREVGPCREVCLTRERRVRSAQRVRPSRRAPTGTSAHRACSASRPCGRFAPGPRRTPRYTAVRSRRVCPSDRSRAVRLRRGAVRSRSHGARCDADGCSDSSRYHRRPGSARCCADPPCWSSRLLYHARRAREPFGGRPGRPVCRRATSSAAGRVAGAGEEPVASRPARSGAGRRPRAATVVADDRVGRRRSAAGGVSAP